MADSPRIFRFEGFSLDATARLLTKGSTTIPLAPKEFDILQLLVESAPSVVTKQELLQRVWPSVYVSDATLGQHIFVLRKSLAQSSSESIIETAPKVGYRLRCAVEAVTGEPEEAGSAAVTRGRPFYATVLSHRRALFAGGIAITLVLGFGFLKLASAPPAPAIELTPEGSFAIEPTFAPSGESIAYAERTEDAGFDIFRKELKSGRVTRLTRTPPDDRGPAWSPDGQWIVFVRAGFGDSALILIPAAGGEERRLTSLAIPSDGARVAWMADSRTVVYYDPSDLTEHAPAPLRTLNIYSGERKALTDPPAAALDNSPAVSPDGKSLAFIRKFSEAASDIFVMPVSGGEPVRVTHENAPLGMVGWAPDGRTLLFSGRYRGVGGVWRVAPGGGTPERAVHRFAGPFAATPAGDGKLVYTIGIADENVWRLDLAGDGETAGSAALWIGSEEIDGGAEVSPDGARIAFVSTRTGQTELWVTEAEPLFTRQMTTLRGPEVHSPSWSPDGAWIVFESRAGGANNVYKIASNGGAPIQLTKENYAVYPRFSHDGHWITYASDRTGRLELWRMPASGGEARQITSTGAAVHQQSPDGGWIYYSRPELPGLARIPWNGGKPQMVTDRVTANMYRYWAVGKRGLYFVEPVPSEQKSDFKLLDLESGQEKLLYTSRRHHPAGLGKLALAPNERWLLFTQTDRLGRQLLLLPRFQ